jgi:hypothetical protein
MKHLFKQLILEEKLKDSPDLKKIQKMQQKVDGELTIKDLTETGMIMTRESFEKSYYNPPVLDDKCKDVMTYIGRNYIQMLSNGFYLLDYPTMKPKRSKKLEVVEEALFNYLTQNNVE